jgi:hypothetical protein
MGKHSLEDGSFWRSAALFFVKWIGIAVLPALAIFGIAQVVADLGSPPEEPSVIQTTPEVTPSPESTTAPPPPPPSPSPSPEPTKDGPLQVLNGTSRAGLAGVAAKELREAGYTVSEIGNAARRYDKTTVFFQPGEERLAEEVAAFIGSDVILPAPDNLQENIPVTVVLGADYES